MIPLSLVAAMSLSSPRELAVLGPDIRIKQFATARRAPGDTGHAS
jgi:hypothetical protein